MRFDQLSVSTRLSMLLAWIMLLTTAIGIAGLLGMREANQGLNSVYKDRVIPLKQIKRVSDAYAVDVVDAAHKMRDGGFTQQQALASLGKAKKDIIDNWSDYMATDLVKSEVQLAKQFVELKAVADKAVQTIETLVRANDVQALNAYAARELYPAIDPLQEVLGALVQVQLETARAEYESSLGTYETIKLFTMLAIGSGVMSALGFGYYVARSIVRQLGTEPAVAASLATSVARGDLTVAIDLRADDTTSLMAQLKYMQESLVQMVGAVHQSSVSVAGASLQIAEGNNDLSSRTEEQASALQQTSASMEQFNSTVQQNTENSRRASQLANQATNVAIDGGAAVADVVRTMKEINESSSKITDIIGVIDSIAFQTNILALNAAVEAARAGEQGRGFAVVASEVRNLAGRSAVAAREIKKLISGSVERVKDGTALVDRAGQKMQEVVESIRQVSEVVNAITTAGAEQALGVDQINVAVLHMDQATQQNAALVEEMAATAALLNQQATELVQQVTTFRLPEAYNSRPKQAASI